MRVLHWAILAFSTVTHAEPNVTKESRNLLPSTFRPPQHFRNVNLVRHINLEKGFPHETVNVVIENVDKQPQAEYFYPFEQHTLARVGGFDVKDKKQPETIGFTSEIVGIDPSSSTEFYKIRLPKPLAPKEQLTLSINYYVLSALQPLPAQIGQTDKHYVLHEFSAFAPSAYKTAQQKTKLKLPTTNVPDFTVLPASLNAEGKEDPQKQGTSFTYGPYGEREAGAVHPVSVRYEFTKPLTHCKLLERDVEVSHWGNNLAVEERLWLTNRAATLKDQFSRVTYQQTTYFNPPTPALREMRFPLAIGSADAYFVDEIGNVSTSRFRSSAKEANLELKPRYPVFGGWNYSFKVGWNNNLNSFVRKLKSDSDSFVLKVPFFEGPKQGEGIEYERIVSRILLPEGSKNVKFETSVPLINSETGLYRTYMDTVGRTTVTLTAINLVDDFRTKEVIVTYDYPFYARFRKPLTIVFGLLLLFGVTWLVGSLDVSIGQKQKQKRA